MAIDDRKSSTKLLFVLLILPERATKFQKRPSKTQRSTSSLNHVCQNITALKERCARKSTQRAVREKGLGAPCREATRHAGSPRHASTGLLLLHGHNLQQVRVPRHLLLHAMHADDLVADLDEAAVLGRVHRALEHVVRALEG